MDYSYAEFIICPTFHAVLRNLICKFKCRFRKFNFKSLEPTQVLLLLFHEVFFLFLETLEQVFVCFFNHK